jgi:hypothetical protein
MKSFKQFLFERLEDDIERTKTVPVTVKPKQSLPPSRKNYPDTEEGTQQWKKDVNSWVPQARKDAESMTNNAESAANTLGKIETGLKTAEAVTDTALSVGAVAVPGAGTALNAAVKGVKGGINASEGNYLAAGLNAVDAALPMAGQLKTAGKVASTVGSLVRSPIASGLEKTAEALGVTKTLAGETVKAVPMATEVLSNTGAQLARNVAAKSGIKIASRSADSPIKSTVSDVMGSMVSDTDTSRTSKSPSTMLASSYNSKGRINMPKM